MRLETIDPHSHKAVQTKLLKNPQVCQKVSKIQPFENVKIYKEMYGHPGAVRLKKREGRGRGRGRGRKETLADKPLDFENRPLCLSCLTDFMWSSSIQVAFVILVLARFEILDHCIFRSNKNHTRLP